MSLKWKKWVFLGVLALTVILSGCNKKTIAPPPAPFAPSNLTATAVSTTQIDLTWSDNSSDEEGFYVYRKASNYTKIAILNANATSYSDTGLSAETTYWYKITAYNDGRESGPSNEVNVTTPPEPLPELEAPSNLSASVISYKQINLSWQDNSTTEDGFRVRCNIGHTRTETIATLLPNATRYEHCKLQPITDHKYYIEVFRGEETAGSPQVSATTLPAPVEILPYTSLTFVPNTRYKISGDVKSQADEPCLVEITGYLYKQGTTEPVATGRDTFYLGANSLKHFEIYIVEGGSTEPKCYPNCDYSVEITDVEIEY